LKFRHRTNGERSVDAIDTTAIKTKS
jgi:hypothetical protein